MALVAERIRGLMEVKGRLQQHELEGLDRAVVTKCLNGHRKATLEDAKRLAEALDVTIDYLAGRGQEYGSYEDAASKMAFQIFERDISISVEQKQRCRRLVDHPEAPRTARAWKALAQMIDLAIGPTTPRIVVAGRNS